MSILVNGPYIRKAGKIVMGALFSIPFNFFYDTKQLQPLDENCDLSKEKIDSIVSSFDDNDYEGHIDNPTWGDPCGLYLEGLKRSWDSKSFEQFLQKNQIPYLKVSKKKGDNYGLIYFDNNKDRKKAYKMLTVERFQEKLFYVNPLHKNLSKTIEECHKKYKLNKVSKSIVDRVTPWLKIDYQEQIRQKILKCTKLLSPITQHITINVVPAPKLQYYSNDVELTIGYDQNHNVCIGFNNGPKLSNYISPINECVNVPENAFPLSERILDFIKNSGIPPFDKVNVTGTWKFVRIRVNSFGEVMLSIVTYGIINTSIISRFKSLFHDINSLYWIETKSIESYGKDCVFHHINGFQSIKENIFNLEFQIFPNTIFPTFLEGNELLLRQIIDNIDNQSIVIDIDSGIGTYTFPISLHVQRVIAFEPNQELFEQAKRIQRINNIKNVQLFNGYFEDQIKSVLLNNDTQNIVVLVHPPQSGLRKRTLSSIRSTKKINNIVYVTSNPDMLVSEWNSSFGKESNNYNCEPFEFNKCVGVDLFPNTERVEVVVSFQR